MPAEPLRIVFLDFDGVLVNDRSIRVRSGGQSTADPLCVDALNRITDATGAAIVVTSTWRFEQSRAELCGILARWGVTGRVIDCTADVCRRRGEEIQAWLDAHRGLYDIESFVILDDEADMAHLGPTLVQTHFKLGLTLDDAERAIRILARGPGQPRP
jgi:hypothetical protein